MQHVGNANANLLHSFYLFKDLSSTELGHVSALAKVDAFNHGDEIFSEGDEARSLYVIKYGSVKIRRGMTDVATLATGSHFGEMSFLDSEKRSATVVALEKTEILSIDFEDLRRVIDADPIMSTKVYRAVANFLCGRLRVTTTDLSFSREKHLRHF